MKKTFAIFGLCLLVLPALSAGTFDLGISLGCDTHLFEQEYDNQAVKLAYGVTMGVTDVWEFDLQANSQLVPSFFGDTSVSLLAQRAMLGQRNTGKRVAGVGVNSLVGAGVLFSDWNDGQTFGLTHLLLSVTPATIGSPFAGKRERILSFAVAYNLETSQVSVLVDLVKYDYYLSGTYRDWD
jgi:hypothetical protein